MRSERKKERKKAEKCPYMYLSSQEIHSRSFVYYLHCNKKAATIIGKKGDRGKTEAGKITKLYIFRSEDYIVRPSVRALKSETFTYV